MLETTYLCFCGYATKRLLTMKNHTHNPNKKCSAIKTLFQGARTKCLMCPNLKFEEENSLVEHLVSSHFTRFSCIVCKQASNQLPYMELHVFSHKDVLIHTSPYCDLKSLNKQEIEKHLERHPNEYRCHSCHATFYSDCDWGKHLLWHEDKVVVREDKSYYFQRLICDVCFRLFETTDQLIAHKGGVLYDLELESEEANTDFQFEENKLNFGSIEIISVSECEAEPTVNNLGIELGLQFEIDFQEEGSILKCTRCSSSIKNKNETDLHLLAHTTECCQSCNFEEGLHEKCSKHLEQDRERLILQGHRMGLAKSGNGNDFNYFYSCMDCSLVTNEEDDPEVIKNYLFCDQCQFSTSVSSLMQFHTLKHKEHKLIFSCPVCLEGFFPSFDAYEQHLNQPHSLEKLEKNMIKENNLSVFNCTFCPFKGTAEIVVHMKNHPQMACALCKIDISLNTLEQHFTRQRLQNFIHYYVMRACQDAENSELYQCKCCDLSFQYKADIEEHVLYEHKHFCKLCGQTHTTRQALWQHMRTHLDVPAEYWCHECFFFSFNAGVMQDHRNRHAQLSESPKPLNCSLCKVLLPSRAEYNRHKFTVHMKNGTFHCFNCRRGFKNVKGLKTHCDKNHQQTDQEKCECTHCLHAAPDELSKADFVHFWTCFYCGEVFGSEPLQQRHLKAEHKDSYYCITCDRASRSRTEFMHHCKAPFHKKNIMKAGELALASQQLSQHAVLE